MESLKKSVLKSRKNKEYQDKTTNIKVKKSRFFSEFFCLDQIKSQFVSFFFTFLLIEIEKTKKAPVASDQGSKKKAEKKRAQNAPLPSNEAPGAERSALYPRGTNIQAGKDAKFTASPQSTEVKSTEGHPTLGAFCAL